MNHTNGIHDNKHTKVLSASTIRASIAEIFHKVAASLLA